MTLSVLAALRVCATRIGIAFIVIVQLFYSLGPDFRPRPEAQEESRSRQI